MAVFTTFDPVFLERYLYMFGLGELASFSPIETGIENSNYLLRLDQDGHQQEYVLTILEYLSFDEVPFFNTLMTHLSQAGLPVPAPRATLDGMTSTIFRGKPTLLFPKLAGSHPTEVDSARCQLIGKMIASMHEAAATIGLPPEKVRANPYDAEWTRSTFEAKAAGLTDDDRALLAGYVERYDDLTRIEDLPRGIIHGDLFRDNTLFEADRLTGIIDFYHACEDYLVQDLAISLNDWCSTDTGDMDPELIDAMIEGYEYVRSLTLQERELLPDFQRAAALRFVLTRLLSGEEGGHLKDPEEFLRIARSLHTDFRQL
ncbi:MAG: homoserine kinase [Pseudomonadales bacterium]|nr:homoserine kinase [Pseudomonadales bacterium]